MKRNILSIAAFAMIAVIAVSCGGGDKSRLPVPKDASVVVHINASGLTKKLSWDEIKQTNWFREMYAGADDSLAKKMMENPAASGIDIEKDMLFFVKRHGAGGYMAFEGSVKDAAAFEVFNKQINKEATASKSGDLNLMKLRDGGVLSYNNERFVYVVNAPVAGGFPGMGQGISRPYSFPADSLQMFGTALYDLPSKESMYEDDRFAATMKEEGDLHVWMNNEQNYGGMASNMMGLMKINALFDKNATGMALNFADGKISVKTKQFFNKQVMDLLKKHPSKDISADLINRIPSQNVVAAVAMNYPPEGLKQFLILIGVDGMINGYLQQVGFTVDEFVKANKGDIVFAVTDLNVSDKNNGERNNDSVGKKGFPDAKIMFATSVNDKAAFDKMIGVIAAQVGNIPGGGDFPKISYSLNNGWFAAGNSQEQVNQFLAGGNNNHSFTSRISGQPFGAYIDLNKIMLSFDAIKDSTANAQRDASLGMWQDILITGGQIKNDAMVYEADLNLVNKSVNSLKQLNQYFDKVSTNKK